MNTPIRDKSNPGRCQCGLYTQRSTACLVEAISAHGATVNPYSFSTYYLQTPVVVAMRAFNGESYVQAIPHQSTLRRLGYRHSSVLQDCIRQLSVFTDCHLAERFSWSFGCCCFTMILEMMVTAQHILPLLLKSSCAMPLQSVTPDYSSPPAKGSRQVPSVIP